MTDRVTIYDLVAERARREQKKRKELEQKKKRAEESLYEFVKLFWHVVEPSSPFIDNWAIEGICKHLEAVTDGRIKRLIMNISPGMAKSLTTGVFWPAWEHGPQNMPEKRYLCTSSQNYITERDNSRYLRIVNDPLYQKFWGDRFSLISTGVSNITNDKTGFKLATSIGADIVGKRANRVIIDDPNSTDPKRNESDTQRESINLVVTEAIPDRLDSIERDAIVIIQQRTNLRDVSGTLLAGGDYVHFCVPMEYDPDRHCTTSIGWTDPRTVAGESCFPERFPKHIIENLKKVKGPFAWAGQYQQSPQPRGGGIIREQDWQLWDETAASRMGLQGVDQKLVYPTMEFVAVSIDTAYSSDTESDYSACVTFGLWHNEHDVPKVMLLDCWKDRMDIHGKMPDRNSGETDKEYLARNRKHWGLVERVIHTCNRFKADVLLIENKASGKSVAQELARLFRDNDFGVHLIDPRGDKVARVYKIQHLFTNGVVYAPDREWAQDLIDDFSVFPKGPHDDTCDAASQGLSWLRDTGWALRAREADRLLDDVLSIESSKEQKPIYNV